MLRTGLGTAQGSRSPPWGSGCQEHLRGDASLSGRSVKAEKVVKIPDYSRGCSVWGDTTEIQSGSSEPALGLINSNRNSGVHLVF